MTGSAGKYGKSTLWEISQGVFWFSVIFLLHTLSRTEGEKMQNTSFLKGMGMGLAIGASVGMALAPKRKNTNVVGKALKAAGELAENITDAMMK